MRALFALLVLATIVAPPAAASEGDNFTHVVVNATEDGCPAGKTFCFDATVHGEITDGETIEVAFTNLAANSSPHNFCFVIGDDYDPLHKDSQPVADQCTEMLQPGDSAELTIVLPTGAMDTYFWCDVAGHETLGMWGEWDVMGISVDEEETTGDDDEEGTEDTPGLAVGVLLLGAGLVALVGSRRRAP